MAAALNAFMQIAGAAGESKQEGYAGWIELQSWEWEVLAETSWSKGGGASVGKPSPGALSWEHYWDTSSSRLLGYICTGSAFSTVELHMCKSTGVGAPQLFWKAILGDVFITKVNQSATEEGNVAQKVDMVFKSITIEYKKQDDGGKLGANINFDWDIPGGKASPGAP